MSKILIDEAAVKLALEALENSIDLVSQETRNAEELYGKYPTRLARIQGLVAFEVAHEKAITALKALAAQPAPAQQEPVACFIRGGVKGASGEDYAVEFFGDKPLPPDGALFYTSPQAQPAREPLTDEEISAVWSWSMTAEAERTANTQQHAFARAIEAKLKEKNNG